PIVEALHQEMGKSFTLLKIDGGTQTALCQALQIPGFPTFIVYKNGKQVWRHEGLATLEVLRNQLK
ncbi:MAG TPA: thioredoxin family protein, partial [Phnomibacter sp.]|nr:thioredoxin family protein [Phnomibacter sp.]